jgi:hypothetical protein
MSSCLKLVTEQFPNLREQVADLFERDSLFRELCEDYEICQAALSVQGSSEPIQLEYAALRLRLEAELLRHLKDDQASRS